MSKKIPLVHKNSFEKYAIVDDDDFIVLSKWEWKYFNTKWGEYARRYELVNKVVICILMHRQVVGAKKGDYVDHIDRNGLNNRKSNLRLCTNGQNAMNSIKRSCWMGLPTLSKYKGVSFFKYTKRIKRWYAFIKINGKPKNLGYFLTEKEAAIAYNEAALKYYG